MWEGLGFSPISLMITKGMWLCFPLYETIIALFGLFEVVMPKLWFNVSQFNSVQFEFGGSLPPFRKREKKSGSICADLFIVLWDTP